MTDQSRLLHTMENLIAAYNDHDVDRILDCMTEDCIFHTYGGAEPTGTVIIGAEAIANRSRMWFERFPDGTWINERHAVTTDRRGMTTWTFAGSDCQTGQVVRRNGCDLFEFRGEKVAMKDNYQKQAPSEPAGPELKPFVAYESLGAPLGRYVHAMQFDRFLFISGMGPLDDKGILIGENVEDQTRATLENMRRVLELAGLDFRHVAKETIYLTNVADRFATHAVRDSFYGDHVPASTLIGVNELVVPGMKIEVDAVAVVP